MIKKKQRKDWGTPEEFLEFARWHKHAEVAIFCGVGEPCVSGTVHYRASLDDHAIGIADTREEARRIAVEAWCANHSTPLPWADAPNFSTWSEKQCRAYILTVKHGVKIQENTETMSYNIDNWALRIYLPPYEFKSGDRTSGPSITDWQAAAAWLWDIFPN